MQKNDFGALVIVVCAILQGVAWATGHNGAVTGGIMLIIGSVAGSILGFAYGKTKQ